MNQMNSLDPHLKVLTKYMYTADCALVNIFLRTIYLNFSKPKV